MHEDLAILTGGLPVTQELGLTLDNIQLWQLGRAERVVVDRRRRRRSSAAAATRRPSSSGSRQIRAELEANGHLNEYERDKLRERMARLGGQVAVIRVGAATETELAERMHRVAGRGAGDARGAPRGDPPGRRRRAAERAGGDRRDRRSRRTRRPAPKSSAARSRSRCARSPATPALEPSVVVGTVRGLKPGEGLDAATGAYCDLVEAGVIDPTLVTRSALEHAASIAKVVLVTECLVTRSPHEDDLLREAQGAERHGAPGRAPAAAGADATAPRRARRCMAGIDAVARHGASVTLGPRGRNVAARARRAAARRSRTTA